MWKPQTSSIGDTESKKEQSKFQLNKHWAQSEKNDWSIFLQAILIQYWSAEKDNCT